MANTMIPEDSGPQKMPLWLQMFQSNMLGAIADLKDDIKDMVTRETFNEYKETTSREIKSLKEENKELKENVAKETLARQSAEIAQANKVATEAQARQKVQSATNWQWVLIVATVALNYFARFLPGGTP